MYNPCSSQNLPTPMAAGTGFPTLSFPTLPSLFPVSRCLGSLHQIHFCGVSGLHYCPSPPVSGQDATLVPSGSSCHLLRSLGPSPSIIRLCISPSPSPCSEETQPTPPSPPRPVTHSPSPVTIHAFHQQCLWNNYHVPGAPPGTSLGIQRETNR